VKRAGPGRAGPFHVVPGRSVHVQPALQLEPKIGPVVDLFVVVVGQEAPGEAATGSDHGAFEHARARDRADHGTGRRADRGLLAGAHAVEAAVVVIAVRLGVRGGYLVQVSSQKNEADAQASYRALQGKYPSVLGSQTSVVKRVDLGEKGVYYRAFAGPFSSVDQATQVCSNLKAAGGPQCIIQRN